MEVSLSTVVFGIAALIPSVIGFFMVRTMNQVDDALKALSGKVDSLTGKDTELAVAIGELKVEISSLKDRVRTLEAKP